MPTRTLPFTPDLDQLRRQAKELKRNLNRNDPVAIALAEEFHAAIDPPSATLAEAQKVVANSYGHISWSRLMAASTMINAIVNDDSETVRKIAQNDPALLETNLRDPNWGPPLSFAANLGRDQIIDVLHAYGAIDTQKAFARACLQGRVHTARKLLAHGARVTRGLIMGPCETLNADGLEFLLDAGATVMDAAGDKTAPIGLLLGTYWRHAQNRRRCFAAFEKYHVTYPDTPAMAVHRGRLDLLKPWIERDPKLLERTLDFGEIYPQQFIPAGGPDDMLCGTPIRGATLLHLCTEYAEYEIGKWLIEQGADVNLSSSVDANGFGGHTPLYHCVVSQPYLFHCEGRVAFTEYLLQQGARQDHRASLRKAIRYSSDESFHEYRDVTPRQWGERFHDQSFVDHEVMDLLSID